MVKVEGESAWPELIPQKTYLATGVIKPRVGDFAVFKNPQNEKEILVKKVTMVEDGLLFVEGNVPWSQTSRDFGMVAERLVLGKIIKKKRRSPTII